MAVQLLKLASQILAIRQRKINPLHAWRLEQQVPQQPKTCDGIPAILAKGAGMVIMTISIMLIE